MRLRAPRDDGAVLAVPPLAEAGRLVAANRRLLGRDDVLLLGQPLSYLREQARRAAVDQARFYLQEAGEPVPDASAIGSLLLAGHQPEIFHPGVWVKNFALCGLARRHGLVPLNLIVDSDAPKSTTLHVPAWQAGQRPHLAQVPFDYWHGETPYEDRQVQDEAIFTTFADRLQERTRDWFFEPLLPAFWKEVMKQSVRTSLLGERFTAARRTFERRWNCHNLELPLSRLLATEPAFWFVGHLLANAGAFHAIYNEIVLSYRLRHGIRSQRRPVPELASDGDWLEMPFWAWRSGQLRRRRLFVRLAADAIHLRAGSESWPSVARRNPAGDLQAMSGSGHKIRTRALTTTLLARLFLADLFIHGIGGGIYDELTDEIIRHFYKIEPPAFLVLSATLLPPFPRHAADEQTCRRLAHKLRDLHWNPQRHLPDPPLEEIKQLALAKDAWIGRQVHVREEARQRFQALRGLTRRLEAVLRDQEDALRRELENCRALLHANEVVERRDLAFCFYPEPMLREFCGRFLES